MSTFVRASSSRVMPRGSFAQVGGVHDALSLGCDLTAVMISGRWTSPEMPARYGRLILTTRSAAARIAEAHEA